MPCGSGCRIEDQRAPQQLRHVEIEDMPNKQGLGALHGAAEVTVRQQLPQLRHQPLQVVPTASGATLLDQMADRIVVHVSILAPPAVITNDAPSEMILNAFRSAGG